MVSVVTSSCYADDLVLAEIETDFKYLKVS